MNRHDVLEEAVNNCYKELYSICQPSVEWEDFMKQNKEWKEGPKPYEFYYLPQNIFNIIVDDYIYAYKLKPTIPDSVTTLINYLNDPIIDKYIKKENELGYRGYEHITPLKDIIGEESYNHVIEYLNKAAKFYDKSYELNSFSMTILLGATPSSNKEAVIENWKKYRNKDIVIDDSKWDDYYSDF